jgi:RHS repeat-associated protein
MLISAASKPMNQITSKERDAETGLDYFGARYYSGAQGRFASVDPLYFQAEMLPDPQRFNLYAYARNNPLKFVDPTGRYIELIGDEEERNEMLGALQAAVGTEAGKYLKIKKKRSFFGLGKDHFYVDVTDKKAFAGTNAVANKLGGIINDADREATLRFVDPGTKISDVTVGPLNLERRETPGVTTANFMQANVNLTRGNDLGSMPGDLMEDGKPCQISLPQVIMHEFGHVDSMWYHNMWDLNGVAVRTENQVRQIQQVPSRVGHTKRGDVRLGPSEF